ncbi:hypothetical protein ACVXG7_31385 [Enterobacter hormaechei]
MTISDDVVQKTALLMSAILNHPLRTALPFVRIICAISLSFLGAQVL